MLHELLLLLAVAERRQDVEEDLKQGQTLSRHAGQGEDGCDATAQRDNVRDTPGLNTQAQTIHVAKVGMR